MNYLENIHYSLDTEKNVLGALLLEPDAYDEVHGTLSPECFYSPDNKSVYEAIESISQTGGKVDSATVANVLSKQGVTQMNNNNLFYHLATLSSNVVSTAHLKDWAYILREKYASRKMLELSFTLANAKDDPFDRALKTEQILEKIFDIKDNDDWRSSEQVGRDLLRHMDEAAQYNIPGIPTGLKELDNTNGGFRKGDLVVIGARPSVGKSAFMGMMCLEMARKGIKIGLVSLEMKDHRILARIVSIESEVPHAKIDRGRFIDNVERNKVLKAVERLSGMPIYMSQTTRITARDIRTKAKKLHKKYGLGALFIDYLQLVEPNSKDGNREQQVAAISRTLKELAMEIDIPIILLAQLNRESEKRSDKRPSLADLRESGAIEQDADVVMLLHRDYHVGIQKDENGISTKEQADLFIPKWRDGRTIHIKLGFDGEQMRFFDPSDHPVYKEPEPNHHATMQQVFRNQNKEDLPF